MAEQAVEVAAVAGKRVSKFLNGLKPVISRHHALPFLGNFALGGDFWKSGRMLIF
jgi:hypothetical protein